MDRIKVINWLNKRLISNVIDDGDINFIRLYIYHFTKQNIGMDKIINSVRNSSPQRLTNIFEFMANKLLIEFNIQTQIEQNPFQASVFGNFMGMDTKNMQKIIKYY